MLMLVAQALLKKFLTIVHEGLGCKVAVAVKVLVLAELLVVLRHFVGLHGDEIDSGDVACLELFAQVVKFRIVLFHNRYVL